MTNFWDYNVWGFVFILIVLFGSLLAGNVLKRKIPFLKNSLIPTSVLGGILILIAESVYSLIKGGGSIFELSVFGTNGNDALEIITYHTLALGFIASSFKTTNAKLTKTRVSEIFNTGLTTVGTYLLQGVLGMGITIAAAFFIDDFFEAAGLLLPFGYGQGTGQALNYGNIYEQEFGFVGGKSFGLTIAALGFLSASIGGVIHLNILKARGKLVLSKRQDGSTHTDKVEELHDIPLQESIDKLTVQLALIMVAYGLSYLMMWGLAKLVPSMKSAIYGFNFILGVVSATIVKTVVKTLYVKRKITRKYTNNFLMTRLSNLFFDVMVVAGIAAIRLDTLKDYWGIMIILGVSGAVLTYVYNRFVAQKLFPDYYEEQFLTMYGMLTGTASTGIILLREVDGDFKTPASDNMVYQNLPAIVFGFPIMLIATFAPKQPILTVVILSAAFIAINILLFRGLIFKKKKK